MSAVRTLRTESGEEIQQYTPHFSHFLDRTTVIYGASGGGKSVVVRNILKEIKDHVEQILVVSPTNPSNHDYDAWAPMQLIHPRMYLPPPPEEKKDTPQKAALRFLRSIWERCEFMTGIHKKANRLHVLKQLYRRVRTKEGDAGIEKIEKNQKRAVELIRRKHHGDEGMIEDECAKIEKKSEEMLTLIYKRYINNGYDALWKKWKSLSPDEQHSLKFINFNPRMVLLLDDCAAELKPLFNKEEFRLVFYQGRHNFLTTIIAVQDDTDLPANLRKNAYISIFVDQVSCTSNFERATNKFPKGTRDLVSKELAPAIYKIKYRLMVYIREDPKQINFYWIKFPIPVPCMLGSDMVKAFCGFLANEGGELDKDNQFFNTFITQ